MLASDRPLSPSSAASSSGDPLSAGARTTRIVRSCVLETETCEDDDRVNTRYYLRIALPTGPSTRDAQPLLSLTPLSHLLDYATYTLPLSTSLSSSSTDALEAANKLGLTSGSVGSEGGASSTPGRRTGATYLNTTPNTSNQHSVRLVVENGSISAVLEGSSRPSSPQQNAREARSEFMVVLRMSTSFGLLRPPAFAYSVTLPTPLCLRNTLAFTLPSSSPSSSNQATFEPPQWDLSIRPTLQSSNSTTSPDGKTIVTGKFALASSVTLRWTEQTDLTAPLVIPNAQLDVAWGIGELGWGRATVKASGSLEFAGLRDRQWIELSVVHVGADLSRRVFEVKSVTGEGVVKWDIATGDVRAREESPPPRLAPEPTDQSTTPKPRRRPSSASSPSEPRPPSFTSLFDVAPPTAPAIDPRIIAKIKQPSLLNQAAPFDADSSLLNMTFEDPSNVDTAASESSEAREADSDLSEVEWSANSTREDILTSTIRVQVNLASLLRSDSLSTFAFEAVVDFPTITSHTLTTSTATSTRVTLPTFSTTAVHEEAIVTVAAGPGASVELLSTDPMLSGRLNDSPLPSPGFGRARWRTERSEDDMDKRRSRGPADLVEVEISLPPSRASSRPTSLLLVQDDDSYDTDDDSPTPAVRTRPSRAASLHSLRSRSSRSSLLGLSSLAQVPPPPQTVGLLKLRITPVPPRSPLLPWRLFSHVSFDRPFHGSFELPLGSEAQSVAVCDSWDATGRTTTATTEEVEAGGLRVNGEDATGLSELLFSVAQISDDGKLVIGDVLPKLDCKVSRMEVEVAPVAGYELNTANQLFDSSTPLVTGASTTFQRFQIPPSEASQLSVTLEPQHIESDLSPPKAPSLSVSPSPSPSTSPLPSPSHTPPAFIAPSSTRATSWTTHFLRWTPFLAVVVALIFAYYDPTLNDAVLRRFPPALEVYDQPMQAVWDEQPIPSLLTTLTTSPTTVTTLMTTSTINPSVVVPTTSSVSSSSRLDTPSTIVSAPSTLPTPTFIDTFLPESPPSTKVEVSTLNSQLATVALWASELRSSIEEFVRSWMRALGWLEGQEGQEGQERAEKGEKK